jgi:thioredoxin 1
MQGRTYSALSFLLLTMAVSAPLGSAQGKTPLARPTEKRDIYPANVDAKAEIAEAVANAAKTHRRVILVFGGNWCYDCHVLDAAFHSPEIEPTLNKNFVVVHVNIGEFDKNLAIADSDGKVLFSQKHGEFEAARSMATEDVLVFLNKWKPEKSVN